MTKQKSDLPPKQEAHGAEGNGEDTSVSRTPGSQNRWMKRLLGPAAGEPPEPIAPANGFSDEEEFAMTADTPAAPTQDDAPEAIEMEAGPRLDDEASGTAQRQAADRSGPEVEVTPPVRERAKSKDHAHAILTTIEADTGPIKAAVNQPGGAGAKAEGGGTSDKFHKRLDPIDFSKILDKARRAIRNNLSIVMIFTLASNVLILAIPIYLFQISDRVLTSRSIDTLVMLTAVIVGAVLLQAVTDALRRFILMRTAVEVAVQLGRADPECRSAGSASQQRPRIPDPCAIFSSCGPSLCPERFCLSSMDRSCRSSWW